MATGNSGSDAWQAGGNSGTFAGSNFVGTLDNQSLDFRTNNLLRTRITTKGQLEFYNTGQSVFIGQSAGASEDLAGRANVFIGTSAGTVNTSGKFNVAVGTSALESNLGSIDNTAVGYGAANTSTGGFNTALGYVALSGNITGTGNTAIGTGSGNSGSSFSNCIALGFAATAQSSNEIRIGTNTQTKLYCEAAKNAATANAPNLYIDGISGQVMKSTANTVTGAGNAGKVAFWDSPSTLSNNALFHWDNANGVLGIGTTSPDPGSKLHVVSPNTYAGYFTSSGTGLNPQVIHAEYTGIAQINATAVYGKAVPNYGYGTGGYFEGGSNGVTGYVRAYTNADFSGVYGSTYNSNAYGPSNHAYGVYGESTGFSYYSFGLFGHAHSYGGISYGVYGDATGSGTNYAGYFNGNVGVVGLLSKGGGSFKIDHPLDPENKYLYHSFVESPDMKNIYDGVALMDEAGEAVVELPAYFEALNKDFRYQLTCVGGFAQVYIAEEISGNRFKISGGKAGLKVSWQVTGTRHDAFAEQNRIPGEVEKQGKERGKYLHPEAFGKAPELGIEYETRKAAIAKEKKQ